MEISGKDYPATWPEADSPWEDITKRVEDIHQGTMTDSHINQGDTQQQRNIMRDRHYSRGRHYKGPQHKRHIKEVSEDL